MHRPSVLLALLAANAIACPRGTAPSAAQGPWAQCGGINWQGGTICTPGWTCVAQNPYYSRCLQSTAGSSSSSSKAATQPTIVASVPHSVSSAVPVPVSSTTTSSSSVAPTSTSAAPSGIASTGKTYKTSITYYGTGDPVGGSCLTNTVACFFYANPGYAAAVSQNLYGVGSGVGQGPACGTCWKLTAQTDSDGHTLSNAGNSIVVMVNDLCPVEGNDICSQSSLTDTNDYGANVNFDLCLDSGAADALFDDLDIGVAVGTAQQVDCSQWSGSILQ